MNELFCDLQKRIALAKQTNEYNALVYRQAIKSEYSNYTTLESEESGNVSELNTYIAPPSLIKELNVTKTPNEEKQEFQYNLQKLFSPSDSVSIVSNAVIDDEMIRTTNRFFSVFAQQVENVKFGSVAEVVNYIKLFVDKLLNRVNVNQQPANIQPLPLQAPTIQAPTIQAPTIQAPTIQAPPPVTQPTPPVTQPIPPVTQPIPPVTQPTPPVTQPTPPPTPNSRECQELVDEIRQTINNFTTIYAYTTDLTQFLSNVLHTPKTVLVCDYNLTKEFYEQVQIIFHQNDKTQRDMMDEELIKYVNSRRPKKQQIKTPIPAKQTSSFYGDLFYQLCVYWDTNSAVKKVVKSYGLMRKPYKKVRYGNGLKSQELTKPKGNQGKKPMFDNYVKGHLYLDVTKLNQNVLCIKYTKTANKKIEIAITDNTKLCILQMITNQFNFNVYEKLTDAERKIIGYLNSVLHLLDEKILPNPIDELYTQFNILRGELEASNDNPLIKSNLKMLAFELHKFGKINSAQLRNVIFELSA